MQVVIGQQTDLKFKKVTSSDHSIHGQPPYP